MGLLCIPLLEVVFANADVKGGAIHPDGLIIATYDATTLKLWDLKSCDIAHEFEVVCDGVLFSENGFHLAAGGSIFDLRKLKKVHDVEGPVAFDKTGRYLFVGGVQSRFCFLM